MMIYLEFDYCDLVVSCFLYPCYSNNKIK